MPRRSSRPRSPQGERLHLLMAQQHLPTLTALSSATGIGVSRLSQAATGVRRLGPRLCARLAGHYGYRPAWLATGDGPPKAHQPGDAEWRRAQAQRLELVRQERGLNPAELAAAVGFSVRTVREATTGVTGVSGALAAAVERCFGYRAAWLREGDGLPLLLPPVLALAADAPGAPSAREVAITAEVLALVERHAPAYLSAPERQLLVELVAVRLIHPRSFLPAPPKRAQGEVIASDEGVTDTAP